MSSNNWLIGVGLAALASVAGNVGINLQKLAHNRIAEKAAETGEKKANYVGHHWWLTGLFLQILGSLFDFAALGFAPQMIVAPLGALTLVVNVLLAPFLLGEKLQRRELVATGIIITGSVIAVVFASHESSVATPDEIFALYGQTRFIVYATLVVTFMGLSWLGIRQINAIEAKSGIRSEEYRRWAKYHRFLYAALSGTMGAQNVLFAKVSAELIISSFVGHGFLLARWEGWLVIFCLGTTIFFQLRWLNQGLERFDALYVIPVFQSFWIVVSVISGMVFFGEYEDMSGVQIVLFALGVGVTVFGVFYLSGRSVHLLSEESDKDLLSEKNTEPLLPTPRGGGASEDGYAPPPVFVFAGDAELASINIDGGSSSSSSRRRRRTGSSSGRGSDGQVAFPPLHAKLDAWLGKGHEDIPVSAGFTTMAATLNLVRKRSANNRIDAATGRLLETLLQGYDMNMFEVAPDDRYAANQGEVSPNGGAGSPTALSMSRVSSGASIFEHDPSDELAGVNGGNLPRSSMSRSSSQQFEVPREPTEDILRGGINGYSLELSPRIRDSSVARSPRGGRMRKLSEVEEESLASISSSSSSRAQWRPNFGAAAPNSFAELDQSPRALGRALAQSLPNSSLNSIMSAVADFGEIDESSAMAPNSDSQVASASPRLNAAGFDEQKDEDADSIALPNSLAELEQPTPALGQALAQTLPNSSMDSIMSALAELGEIEESSAGGSRRSQVASMLAGPGPVALTHDPPPQDQSLADSTSSSYSQSRPPVAAEERSGSNQLQGGQQSQLQDAVALDGDHLQRQAQDSSGGATDVDQGSATGADTSTAQVSATGVDTSIAQGSATGADTSIAQESATGADTNVAQENISHESATGADTNTARESATGVADESASGAHTTTDDIVEEPTDATRNSSPP